MQQRGREGAGEERAAGVANVFKIIRRVSGTSIIFVVYTVYACVLIEPRQNATPKDVPVQQRVRADFPARRSRFAPPESLPACSV